MKTTVSNVRLMDCMAGMAEYPDKYFELAIVDPPYQGDDAIGMADCVNQKAKRTKYRLFDNKKPDAKYFSELKRVSKNQIIWGGNFFGLSGGVIVWNKNGTAFGEAEVAICSTHKSVKIFEFTWNGMIQGNMSKKEYRIHPTQKPIALYEWLLKNYAKPGDKILDTHLGSGSSRIAAYKLGFDFYGFEIDPDYFRDADKRFRDSIAMPLFDSVPNVAEQAKLF